MLDQEQVQKYWAGWVRRQIGGSQIVQDAAVSAAVSAILGGRDNDAAAESARQVARSLGVKVAGDPPASRAAPIPAPAALGQPTSAPPAKAEVRPTPAATSAGITPVPLTAPPGDRQPMRCRLCGSLPAANMTIHEHNGRVVWMVHKTNKGPFCRDCGTALLRHHQNSTLFQGWFGIFSFFITPITLLLNLVAWRKVRGLAPPQRDVGIETRIPAPLNPGKPLLRRPGPYVGAAVIAAVIIFFSAKSLDTGGCLESDTDRANRVTDLHNTYVAIFNRDFSAIDACTSIECGRAPKLEIAAALTTYSSGLNKVCWPSNLKADANSLVSANAAASQAFTAWAGASSSGEDQSLANSAQQKEDDRRAADDKLATDMGVSTAPTVNSS